MRTYVQIVHLEVIPGIRTEQVADLEKEEKTSMHNPGQHSGQWGLIPLGLLEKPMEHLPGSTTGKRGGKSVWTSASALHWW